MRVTAPDYTSFAALRDPRHLGGHGSATLVCVQLEYFDDPESTARPVLLIYGKSPTDAAALQRATEMLAAGNASDVQIDALPSFEGIDGCSLIAQLANTNLGMTRVADTPTAFRCALNSTTWSQIAGLLEPFTDTRSLDAPDIHQYLTSDGPIDWIVATSDTGSRAQLAGRRSAGSRRSDLRNSGDHTGAISTIVSACGWPDSIPGRGPRETTPS